MAAVLVCGTPASTKTVASGVMQVVHAVAELEQGVTADAKLSAELTGQVTGGGCGGGLGGGIGGGDAGHVASAVSDATGTPAATIWPA
jgi:hypothetical protein